MPVVGCLTVAVGILARSEGVPKGTGTDQRFVKNALKNAELPPDSFKYLFFFYFCNIHASLHANQILSIKYPFQILPSIRFLNLTNLFWCPCCNNCSTSRSAFWSHIDNIICRLDNFQIMLNHNDSITAFC